MSSSVPLRILSVLAAGFWAVLASSSEAEITLQRFDVQAKGHKFVVWARTPSSPRIAALLLHGRTWSSLPAFDLQVSGLYRSVLASLASRGIAAYALDQRGYGETPRDQSGWITPEKAAGDAAAVLGWMSARHPRLPKPALIGWSLGAATAHLTAVSSPGELSALVLYGYAPDPDGKFGSVAAPGAPRRDRNSKEAAVSDFISPQVTEPAVIKAFVETALRTDPVHIDWKDESQFLADPARIKAPTLLIYGERDPNIDQASLQRFYRRLAVGEKLTVKLPGADHCAHLETTHDSWISAVADFLLHTATPGR